MITAGFHTETITPPIPIELSGYAGIREATGVHDELYVKSIVVQSEETKYALIIIDLLSVDDELSEYIRNEGVTLGFAKNNIQILATHTHSGPVGIHDTDTGILKGYSFFLGKRNEAYFKFVGERIISSLKKAMRKQYTQYVKIGKIKVLNISSNRSRPELDCDNTLLAFDFESEKGEKNLLLRFANHPTVLDTSNTLVSADFVGDLYNRFSGQYKNVLFLNGACGDISTRHTRRESGFSELERIGEVIEEKVNESFREPIYEGLFDDIQMENKMFKISTKKPKKLEELERRYSQLTDDYEKISVYSEIVYTKNQTQQVVDLSVNILNIQGVVFVLMPVEIFSTLTLDFIEAGYYYTSFANSYYTYLPDSESYDKDEYESCLSPFARGEGERIIGEVQKWVEELI